MQNVVELQARFNDVQLDPLKCSQSLQANCS